ncbi:uncharacterized protein TRAVEDRAFT_29546 [Trametes versicolor FP-101664 SS1]|uniref:uncharacterized protein n=1 Tax=Trametes versicolor (strain FP-101664) TaxID=717944 RepID=UPI000462294A|nr:uncharacterized protein TRAVEDRAFT_29546 [Trametes versicolor FP-101664 SS1]EIW57458.1 hypothetical protein TRAVEDRAFT_29546 [Trametes versicolor FP-101664 SS1]
MTLTLNSPLHVLQDSGRPAGSTDYTTVVILHGFTWHSGIFTKLLPLAHPHNVRIVLVNRRDYLGSKPYIEEDRALLPELSPEEWADAAQVVVAGEKMKAFMRERAREVHDLLVELVRGGNVVVADRSKNTGGIVVAGWSLGGSWMTAFLAHVTSFPADEVRLSDYMRRVVIFDSPFLALGYPPREPALYSPLLDPKIAPEDRQPLFMKWVSGYFPHGGTPDTLEGKTPLENPPPTISTLTLEEIASMTCPSVGAPGGSDEILVHSGVKLGLFAYLRKCALYLPEGGGGAWRDVEVRCVTGEWSISGVLWATMLLKREVEDAKAKGIPIRDVRFVLIRRANHFVRILLGCWCDWWGLT